MPFVLSSADGLLAATGGHPFVRSSLRFRHLAFRGWTSRGATVWVATEERPELGGESVTCFGPGAEVVELLGEVADLLPEGGGLTAPRDAAELLGPDLPRPTRWDFRALVTPPPEVPGEAAVEVLPVEAYPQAASLLDRANPTASVRPGSPVARLWAGVRDAAGRLVAVAADTSHRGIGHTSAVATDPDARGRGLGAAVTAYLARTQVATFGLATLGFYADNGTARRLYDRLGYGYGLEMASGALSRRCSPAR